jgi:hypothetical protein
LSLDFHKNVFHLILNAALTLTHGLNAVVQILVAGPYVVWGLLA